MKSLGVEKRKYLLVLFDLIVLIVATLAACAFTVKSCYLFLTVPLWLILLDGVGAYHIRFISRLSNNLRLIIGTGFFVFPIYLALFVFIPSLRTFLVLHFSLSTLTLMLIRFIYTKVFYSPQFKRKVLILANGDDSVEKFIRDFPEFEVISNGYELNVEGLKLKGDENKQKVEGKIYHSGGSPVGDINASNSTNTINAITNLDGSFDEIVVKRDDVTPEVEEVLKNNGNGHKITYFEDLYEKLTSRIHLESLNGKESVETIKQNGNKKVDDTLKRIFDIVGSSVGFVMYSLILPFVALFIKLDSPGPIVYKQKRTGKDGKPYTLGKLRTMVKDAEQHKAVWAKKKDPRITRIGKFLRKTRLDEFMQLLNILKGEMSAIGPRPERPEFDAALKKEIPHYELRYAVRPGMAGWAMVNYGYVATVEDARIRHEYDLYYIKHRSLYLDFKIFLRAILQLALLKGR